MKKKIVTPDEMRRMESACFSKDISEDSIMENVGIEVAEYVDTLISDNELPKKVLLLCGKGNNGADGLVAGLYLIDKGYEVYALSMHPDPELSALNLASKKRFLAADGKIIFINQLREALLHSSLIIDALYGTGFKGAIDGLDKDLIELINRRDQPIVSIDIPSGLNGSDGTVETVAIHATITLAIGAPKRGFYLGQGWNYVGFVETLIVGFPQEAIETLHPSMELLNLPWVQSHLPKIARNQDKYQRGDVTILAGSASMPGSALLASLGAFKGGAGMVHLLTNETLFSSIPELIRLSYSKETPQETAKVINHSGACLIGPGIGRDEENLQFLKTLLPLITIPTVLDADALYFLSQNDLTLPKLTLLTPHRGEMARLLQKPSRTPLDPAFIAATQEYSEKHRVPILLKGGPTFYIEGKAAPIVIPFGDPGMASAGSGDLLGGIIAALLSKKLSLSQAALVGASLHGIAGEIASQELTSYSVMTSDIADAIPKAYQHLIDS